MDILRYIPYGRKNAESRFSIAQRAGISERKFRELAAGINKSGRAIILADIKAGGYYVPKLPEDRPYYNAYLRQEESRVKELNEKIRAMKGKKRADNPDPYQLSLFGGDRNG